MSGDTELLYEFVQDSREHLASIEDDILTIANTKDNPDPELVNKVFRAIHSIKGSAGFFGQKNISTLSHVMESLLLLVRNGEIRMERSVCDALLAGVDKLNAMLGDIARSDLLDISAEKDALSRLLETLAAGAGRTAVAERTQLKTDGGGDAGFEVGVLALEGIPAFHDFLYLLRFDLHEANLQAGRHPMAIVESLQKTGFIVESRMHPIHADLRAGLPSEPLLLDVLYSTVLEPDLMKLAVELPEKRVVKLEFDRCSRTIRGGPVAVVPATAAAPAASAAPAGLPGPAPAAMPAEGPVPAADPGPASDAGGELPELTITPEIAKRFAQEALDLLDTAEQSLLEVEQNPAQNVSLLQESFRVIHSLKGNCGFMGLADLERIAHAMESTLDLMKSGALPADVTQIGELLKALDRLRQGITDLMGGGTGAVAEAPDLLARLAATRELRPAPPAAPAAPAARPVPAVGTSPGTAPVRRDVAPARPAPIPKPDEAAAPTKPAADRVDAAAGAGDKGAAAGAAALARQDIRVDLAKLDSLINLVGELVIAEAMVVRHPVVRDSGDEQLERAIHHLRRISTDLQDIAMTVRMIPLAATFRKMTRLVHDVSLKAGKQATLALVGEDTEVDKTVIELIGDPLVHIVRNSIDHGIEKPADRRAAGKDEVGVVTMEARHEGGEVWILIRDDGRGLQREKILRKAIEKGMVTGDGSSLSDADIFRFIFEPGFSTADKVTDISGRGVGMDVVKKNIDKLKGRVEVRSEPGQGSTVMLRIPLTLAIIDGMLVRVGQAQYTIPLLAIRESIRVEASQITITPDGMEVIRVRQDLIPVLRLHRQFRLETTVEKLADGTLVIVENEKTCAALLVDEILGQQQTVIKGLSDYMGHARGVSGCTILGDGTVSLILDIGTLLRLAE